MFCCFTLLALLLGGMNGINGGFQHCSPVWVYREGKCLRLFECTGCCSPDDADTYCTNMGADTRLAIVDGFAQNAALSQMAISLSKGDVSRTEDLSIFIGGAYNHDDRQWYVGEELGSRELWLQMWKEEKDRLPDTYTRDCPAQKVYFINLSKWVAVDCSKKNCHAAYACERDPINDVVETAATDDSKVITVPGVDCLSGWTRIHDLCYRVFNDCPGGCCSHKLAGELCGAKGQDARIATVLSDYMNDVITDMGMAVYERDHTSLWYIHIFGRGYDTADQNSWWKDYGDWTLWFQKWKSHPMRPTSLMCPYIEGQYHDQSWRRNMWVAEDCFRDVCKAGYACQMRPITSIYCRNHEDPSPIYDDASEWTGDVTRQRFNDTHKVTTVSMIPERDDGLTVQCKDQSGELGNKYVLSVSDLKCPEGWLRYEGRCYGVVRCRYGYMCTAIMIERQCMLTAGGKPARILDKKVNDHIANQAEELGVDYVFLGQKKSDPYPYYNWPTDGYKPTHDCIGMFAAYNNQYRGQWNDTPCDYMIHGWRFNISTGFVCEKYLGSESCPSNLPEPWVSYHDSCYGIVPCAYGFECTGSDSVDHCSSYDAIPAIIPNAYINDLLTHQAERMRIGYLFMGITKNQPYPFTHWATDENQPDGDSSTDCIGMYVRNKPEYKGQWSDMNCKYTTDASANEEMETGYACEIPLVTYGEAPCEKSGDWIRDGHQCYTQKQCETNEEGCSADESVKYCDKIDAEPAAIPTNAVNDHLRNVAANNRDDFIFLGASKYQEELYPEMILNPITYTEWAIHHKDQPNGDESVKCVAMHVRHKPDFKSQWNDIKCDWALKKVLGFACQIYNPNMNRSCPLGWVQNGSYCYGVVRCIGKGKCIAAQAHEYCHSVYAYPAHMPGPEVNWAVSELADKIGIDFLYIGISKFDDGLWYPAPKGYPATFTNWATHEGQPSGGQENRCVGMYVNGEYQSEWKDLPCTDKQVRLSPNGTSYACKRKRKNTDMPSIYGPSELFGPLVPPVKDTGCYVPGEADSYTGKVSVTVSGKTCMRWDADSPHAVTIGKDLPENYCRNPDEMPSPWCYTVDPDTRWEYCDIPVCIANPCPDGYAADVRLRCYGTFMCDGPCSSEDAVELCKQNGGWLAAIDDEGYNAKLINSSLRETWAKVTLFDGLFSSTGDAMTMTSLRTGNPLSFSKLTSTGPLPIGNYCPYSVLYFKTFWEMRGYWDFGSCDEKHPSAAYTCQAPYNITTG